MKVFAIISCLVLNISLVTAHNNINLNNQNDSQPTSPIEIVQATGILTNRQITLDVLMVIGTGEGPDALNPRDPEYQVRSRTNSYDALVATGYIANLGLQIEQVAQHDQQNQNQ